MVAWLLAVERRKQDFVPAEEFGGTAGSGDTQSITGSCLSNLLGGTQYFSVDSGTGPAVLLQSQPAIRKERK